MKEHDEILRELFGDARLEPSRKFERSLRARLSPPIPRPHVRHLLQRIAYAGVAMAILAVVFGLTQLEAPVAAPGKANAPAIAARPKTVLAGNFLKTIIEPDVSQLPDQHTTFWHVQRKESFGPQAKTCLQDPSQPTPPIDTLMYNDHHTSAMLMTYTGNWSYSDNPLVSAVNVNRYLGLNDPAISQMLGGTVLTDASGTPIDPSTPMQLKTSGTYDVYARYAPAAGTKDYVPQCTPLVMHIVIDAASGMFTSFAMYKGGIADANLDLRYDQTVQTQDATSFDQVKSQFATFGFDAAKDDLSKNPNAVSEVDNPAAGFSFWYHQTIFGRVSVEVVKNSNGQVSEYRYHFSSQPSVVMVVRTPQAKDEYPQTIADFEKYATAKGMTLGKQFGPSTMHDDTLGAITMTSQTAAGNGLRAAIYETGSPTVPSEFVQVNDSSLPLQLQPDFVSPHPSSGGSGAQVQRQDPLSELRIEVYKAGTTAPADM